MAISRRHIPYYKEVLSLPGFLRDPVLVLGVHKISTSPRLGKSAYGPLRHARPLWKNLCHRVDAVRGAAHPDLVIPAEYEVPDLETLLRNRGIRDLETLDLFDRRATLKFDLNSQVSEQLHDRFKTLIDIGCIEHVFDTKQCIENCMRMLATGGHYFLHTCVNGYYAHGLHVFNPEALLAALELNGFEVVLERYSTRSGGPVTEPKKSGDVLIWLVARKTRRVGHFHIPQQGMWQTRYEPAANQKTR